MERDAGRRDTCRPMAPLWAPGGRAVMHPTRGCDGRKDLFGRSGRGYFRALACRLSARWAAGRKRPFLSVCVFHPGQAGVGYADGHLRLEGRFLPMAAQTIYLREDGQDGEQWQSGAGGVAGGQGRDGHVAGHGTGAVATVHHRGGRYGRFPRAADLPPAGRHHQPLAHPEGRAEARVRRPHARGAGPLPAGPARRAGRPAAGGLRTEDPADHSRSGLHRGGCAAVVLDRCHGGACRAPDGLLRAGRH